MELSSCEERDERVNTLKVVGCHHLKKPLQGEGFFVIGVTTLWGIEG